MKTYTFRSIIEPDEPGFHGYVPILPGLHTSGKTVEEVRISLKEAIQCHLEGLIKDGELIPQDQDSVEIILTFAESDLHVKTSDPKV